MKIRKSIMAAKGKTLATAPTKEALTDLINEYYFSKNYEITDDNRIHNTKNDKYMDGVAVEEKRGRWVFKRVEASTRSRRPIRAGYYVDEIMWVLDGDDNTWKQWGSKPGRVDTMSKEDYLYRLNHPQFPNPEFNTPRNYVDFIITKNGENPDDYGYTENIKDPFVKASTSTRSRRPIRAGYYDEIPVSNETYTVLIKQFENFIDNLKSYYNSQDTWKVTGYFVPEKSAATGKIRNISFAIEYDFKKPNGGYKPAILVEAFYDPAQSDSLEVTVTCPMLGLKDEYLFSAEDFEDTNFEGMDTIHISSLQSKIADKAYNGGLEDYFRASTRSSRSSIMAATDEYMLSEVIGEKETIIDEWSSEYDGEPSTSWDEIFDNVVNDFELYCDDEASSYGEDRTLKEKFDAGVLSEADMLSEFYDFIRFIDISDYDN